MTLKGDDIVNIIDVEPFHGHLAVDAVKLFRPVRISRALMSNSSSFSRIRSFTSSMYSSRSFFFCAIFSAISLYSAGLRYLKATSSSSALKPFDAEPVSQGRIYLECFPRDLDLLLGRKEIEGLHVVVPVRQLDQYHPDILAHGEDHLSEIFDPGFLGCFQGYLADLGYAVDEFGYLFAEYSSISFLLDV